jgi:REP element-mobilizing transposase RayT
VPVLKVAGQRLLFWWDSASSLSRRWLRSSLRGWAELWQIPTVDEVFVRKRKLPHWRLQGATYFVFWRLHQDHDELSADDRSSVCSCIRHFDSERYKLLGYVVMNDHVHVVVEPFSGYRLSAIVHSWKSFSANAIHGHSGAQGSVWQDEYFDRIVRDEAELAEKLRYIQNNPAKRWPAIGDYRWVWTFEPLE